jgi:phosphatidylglycerol:prolipoprotein diacylglycerol transferase
VINAITFPAWIGVGGWRVHPHLFFELLAYAVAAGAYWQHRRHGGDRISAEDRWALVAAAVVGAVVGSRLLFWFEDPQRTIALLASPQYLVGGQTIVGGLIGGWLAVEWRKRRLGIHDPTGDLFALPIALGAAVGRVGCFLSGLPDGTFGVATSLPWGIDLGDGIARHPTALYESLFMLGLAWWLARSTRTAARGDVFLTLMTAYLAFRLAVDFLKPGVPLLAGLTAIQCAATAGLAACVVVRRRRRTIRSLALAPTE